MLLVNGVFPRIDRIDYSDISSYLNVSVFHFWQTLLMATLLLCSSSKLIASAQYLFLL